MVRVASSDALTLGMLEGGSWAGSQPWTMLTFSVCCMSPQHLQRVHSLSPPIWRSCSGRWSPPCPCRPHHPSRSSQCLWRQVNRVSQQVHRSKKEWEHPGVSSGPGCPWLCKQSDGFLCLLHPFKNSQSFTAPGPLVALWPAMNIPTSFLIL